MSDTIKAKVETLLKRDDEIGILCRNNDNFLILYYIYEYHNDLDIMLNLFTNTIDIIKYSKDLPSLSEIKRIRAYFQNQRGLYLADYETRVKRINKAEEMKQEYKAEVNKE